MAKLTAAERRASFLKRQHIVRVSLYHVPADERDRKDFVWYLAVALPSDHNAKGRHYSTEQKASAALNKQLRKLLAEHDCVSLHVSDPEKGTQFSGDYYHKKDGSIGMRKRKGV